MGIDINPTSYSKLEGQLRIATDKEIYVIAKVLGVQLEDLFQKQVNNKKPILKESVFISIFCVRHSGAFLRLFYNRSVYGND